MNHKNHFSGLKGSLIEDLFSNVQLLFGLTVQQDYRNTSCLAKTIICLKTHLSWPRSPARILTKPPPIHLPHQFQLLGDFSEEVEEHHRRAVFTHNLHIYLRNNTSQGRQSGTPDPFFFSLSALWSPSGGSPG